MQPRQHGLPPGVTRPGQVFRIRVAALRAPASRSVSAIVWLSYGALVSATLSLLGL